MTQSYAKANVRVEEATELKGAVLGNLLQRPDNLIVIGSQWDEYPDGVVEEIAEAGDVMFTKTPNTPDVESVGMKGVSEISHLLTQDDSLGGEYGCVIFVGVPHHIATGLLSKLKHYSGLTSVDLDHGFQPDASLSFPNLSPDEWEEELNAAVEALEG